MGNLVGACATSHTAMIIRKFQPSNDMYIAVHQTFAQVRAEVDRLSPDVLVVGSEGLNSFGYDSLPQIRVGIGETGLRRSAQRRSPTGWCLRCPFPYRGRGRRLRPRLLRQPQDRSRVHGAAEPHSTGDGHLGGPSFPERQHRASSAAVALRRVGRTATTPSGHGPLLRVVLESGELSQWVGTPKKGRINTAFDERLLRRVRADDLAAILAMRPPTFSPRPTEVHSEVTAMVAASKCEHQSASEREPRLGPGRRADGLRTERGRPCL